MVEEEGEKSALESARIGSEPNSAGCGMLHQALDSLCLLSSSVRLRHLSDLLSGSNEITQPMTGEQ